MGLFLDRHGKKAIGRLGVLGGCHSRTLPCSGGSYRTLFLDWQGEKRIATTPRLPFPRQAGGKGNRKRMPQSHDSRFLDRQGEKESQAHGHVPMIAFSSTSRGEKGRMNFMRICWGRPPGLGLAIGLALPERFRRRRNRSVIAALRAADIQKQVCTVQI